MRRGFGCGPRSVVVAAALAAAALVASGGARAQSPTATEAAAGDRAVRLGRQALEAFEAGRFAEAYAGFAEANELSPSPVFVVFMARCQRKLGKLLDARARYRQVIAWNVDASLPEAWSRARADARTELAEVESRVPWLEIEVQGAVAANGAEVLVDGSPAAVGRVEVDPGKHRVSARVGGRRGERNVEVVEGQGGVAVVVDLGAAAPAPIGRVRDAAAPRLAAGTPGPLWPAIAAFALGGAGVAVGSVTGAIASSKASDSLAPCHDMVCPSPREGEIKSDNGSAHDIAAVSTIAFVAGGVALAGGVVLLITRPGGKSPALEARVAPGRVGVLGYF